MEKECKSLAWFTFNKELYIYKLRNILLSLWANVVVHLHIHPCVFKLKDTNIATGYEGEGERIVGTIGYSSYWSLIKLLLKLVVLIKTQ